MKNLFKKYWHILLVIFLVPVIAIVFILKKYGADGNVVVSLTMSALAYYGTVILAVGGDGKDLYAQCGIGAQETGKSAIEVREWYYEV